MGKKWPPKRHFAAIALRGQLVFDAVGTVELPSQAGHQHLQFRGNVQRLAQAHPLLLTRSGRVVQEPVAASPQAGSTS